MVTVIGSIPVILTFVLFGEKRSWAGAGYVLGVLLIFVQYTVTYIFSAMTIYLIYGYLAEGDGRMDRAWAIVRRDFLDILGLAVASTGVGFLEVRPGRERQAPRRAQLPGGHH